MLQYTPRKNYVPKPALNQEPEAGAPFYSVRFSLFRLLPCHVSLDFLTKDNAKLRVLNDLLDGSGFNLSPNEPKMC